MLFKNLLKLTFSLTLLLVLTVIFAACDVLKNDGETTTEPSLVVSTTVKETTQATTQSADDDTDTDADTYVVLDNENTIVSGGGAVFENSVLTITRGGTYSIKGNLTDGKIYVNSAEDKKVKLIFAGVDISCSTDAPVYIENSPKETVIILADGTENRVSDTARSVPEDENADYATAVIYSKDDLQIEGSGKLYVTGNFNKGIFSKNDIDIRGGYIEITSVDDGIRGKDSVEVSEGTLVITCGGDGIRTSEETEEGKGNILISGGNIKITSDLDGIQAIKSAEITGGVIDITSGGGATGDISSDEGMGGMGAGKPGRGDKNSMGIFSRPGMKDSSALEESSSDTPSTKGVKAGESLSISGGIISISSLDDSLHAVNITVEGGEYTLESDDDGIHADETVTIGDGEINITNSYEGIEGKVIEISGGEIVLRSEDDGFNAADGSSSSMDMRADESCKIIMTGGYVHINADGDGVDSNGSVDMSGGTFIVFGPVSGGNGALDYAGRFTVSGGTLLATGSAGMAQSVTASGDSGVLAFNFSQSANVLTSITDGDGDLCIAFTSNKQYSTVVYASDNIKTGETYNVYQGGTITGEAKNGVCVQGAYAPGELVGSLDKSA